jgi:NADH:ubiquinone oxidoreductase subunit E
MRSVSEQTGLEPGHSNKQYDLDWRECTGWCSNAPNVEVDDSRILFDADPGSILDRIDRGGGVSNLGRQLDINDILANDILADIDL